MPCSRRPSGGPCPICVREAMSMPWRGRWSASLAVVLILSAQPVIGRGSSADAGDGAPASDRHGFSAATTALHRDGSHHQGAVRAGHERGGAIDTCPRAAGPAWQSTDHRATVSRAGIRLRIARPAHTDHGVCGCALSARDRGHHRHARPLRCGWIRLDPRSMRER